MREQIKIKDMEGEITFDKKVWMELRLDTPIAPPRSTIGRLELDPGTCVKTVALQENGWPLCGIVQMQSADACVVIGHGAFDTNEEQFVWRGTFGEFKRTWRVD